MDERQFDIKKIEVEGGFLNSNVRCVYKDSRGFMWFGTAHGLCRYDGNEAIEFTTNNSKLPFNDIFEIFEDDQGFLWVCRNYHQTTPENTVFIDINTLEIHDVKEKFGSSFPLGFSLRQGKENVIYFIASTGLKHSYSNGVWHKHMDIINENISDKELHDLFKILGEKGIEYQFISKNKAINFFNLGLDQKGNPIIYSQAYINDNIWDFSKGIQKIEPSGKMSSFLSEAMEKQIFSNHSFRVLSHNSNTGNIWSIDNYHFILCNKKENAIYDFRAKYPKLFYDRILNIEFYDDLVWVCAANGVFTIEIKDNRFEHYLNATDFSEGFNSCRSIYTDDNENLIVSTVNELLRISPDEEQKIIKKGNHSPFLGAREDTLLLMKTSIRSLVKDECKEIAATPNINTAWCAEVDRNNPDKYWIGCIHPG